MHMDVLENLEISGPEGENPEAEFGKRELREHLDNALSQLEESQRLTIEWRYMAERSYIEIADIMNVPVGTVKTHIYRGKAELRRIMKRRGLLSKHKEPRRR